MKYVKTLLFLVAIHGLASQLSAQNPPLPDPTFANAGGLILNLGWLQEYASAVAIQSWDGKIVLAVVTSGSNGFNTILLRLNNDGSLDPSFGVDGIVPVVFSSPWNRATHLLIQPDHKLLVSGTGGIGSPVNATDLILARVLEDGSADTAFGDGGVSIIDIDSWSQLGSQMALQPDQKIVVTTTSFNGFSSHMALVRLLPNGQLDPAFDGDGKVSVLVGDGQLNNAYLIGLQGNNIIVGGSAQLGDETPMALVRFTETGAIDPAFGDNGVFFHNPNPQWYDAAASMAILGDGKILLASTNSAPGVLLLTRITPDGSIDADFGPDGTGAVTPFNCCFSNAPRILIQPNDKILVGGTINNRLGLCRFTADGLRDTTFGYLGLLETRYTNTSASPGLNDMALQPDGRLVVAGHSETTSSSHSGVAVARFNLGAIVKANAPQDDFGSFHFAPNPFHDHGQLMFTLQQPELVSIQVMDIHGRVLSMEEKNTPGHQPEVFFMDPALAPGVYFIQIAAKTWSQTVRAVKW